MSTTPDVSIVITTYNGWRLTAQCLASLVASAKASRLKAEIIISDNCSTDETPRAWQAFQNETWPISFRRNEQNLGYLRNANAGARGATGAFLCLMNNDVIVEEGWLDGLVDVLRRNPDVGLVGPKYLDAERNVIECGCMVLSDGTAVQLGNRTPLDDPRFSHLNEVHYCSMACTVLRTALFRELNGYDERYMPAYYEDVDLCLRIAERGFRVVVSPAVRITHLFGGSHKRDETLRLMEANRAVLRERWKQRLESVHPPVGTPLQRLSTWAGGPTVVFHWPFYLNPNSAAGALRNWHLMTEVARQGYRVVYVALWHDGDKPYLDELRRRGIEAFEDFHGSERDLVETLVSTRAIAAAVMSFAEVEQRYGHLYHQRDPGIVRIFDTVDVHFLRELRAGQREASAGAVDPVDPSRLPESAYSEIACMLRSDAVLLVSDAEKEILTRDLALPAEKFQLVRTIHVPADGVPTFQERQGFSFIGYGGHPPNVDSAHYIVEAIWPEIRRLFSEAKLYVYGFKLPKSVQALHDEAAGIIVRGFVEDHRKAIGGSRVMLAPLRFGAGVKGKIGEALAVGTPVVTTPVGAEGMDPSGRALLIGTEVSELARRAVEVYRDEALWRDVSARGLQVIRDGFSASQAGASLISSIASARRLKSAPSPWTFVAYALVAKQTAYDNPADIASRAGRKVTEWLYGLRRLKAVRQVAKGMRAARMLK